MPKKKVESVIGRRYFFPIIFFLFLFASSCSSSVVLESSDVILSELVREEYASIPERLTLSVYPPTREGIHNGAVVFIHGGGWQVGGSDLPLYKDWEKYLIDSGLRAFSIEHRLAPLYRGEDQYNDIAQAIVYIRNNAKRFAIPEDKIAVVGFSSGGHLALLYGLRNSSNFAHFSRSASIPVKAIVSFYAPTDLLTLRINATGKLKEYLDEYIPQVDYVDFAQSLSPITYATPETPPVMIIHGKDDNLVPFQQAVLFANRAERNGKKNIVFLPVDRADHNFVVSRSYRIKIIRKQCIDFINQNFE